MDIFDYKNNHFEINKLGPGFGTIITVTTPGDTNKQVFTLGHEVRMSDIEMYVWVNYMEELFDVNNTPRGSAKREFLATGQESYLYFYNMVFGNTSIGKNFSEMVIDGWLIDYWKLPYGVYGQDGMFYYPIGVTASTTDNTVLVDNVEQVTSRNLTVTVDHPQEGEVYTYILMSGDMVLATQESNLFPDLALGTYNVLVESPQSMACREVVTI
jgi:hypothetical protein